jgi:hypothetical protein
VPGFGVRGRKGGSKVYVVQYAIGEKTRRMSLGKVELQGSTRPRTSSPRSAWERTPPARNSAKASAQAV